MGIDDVVAQALLSLEDFPILQQTIIKEGYFITRIKEDDGVPIKVNGIIHPPKQKFYTIIDFEMRGIPPTPEEFTNHSLQLYNLFKSIPTWYKC